MVAPYAHIVLSDPESRPARQALACYFGELAERFDTGFDVSRSCDPEAVQLRPPLGGFFVASRNTEIVGCVGLKGGDSYSEIKRLWVCPDHRRKGLARLLMDAAEAHARDTGVRCLRLDTNRALPEAITMYQAWGWVEIPRFNPDPYAQVFFEKQLGSSLS